MKTDMKNEKNRVKVAENRDKFFQPFPADADPSEYRMIKVNKLIKSKGLRQTTSERPSEVDKAIEHIRNIEKGLNGETPRAPIDVLDNGHGSFLILDGNATHEAAKRLGWKELPSRVISTELEDAIALAATVHKGQKDKGGAPYIMHPLRMMMRMSTPEAQIAAVLHDVVEDSSVHDKWTIERLRNAGYSETVLTAVDCLTERDGEDYVDFVTRASANPIARQVKIADIEDNMDLKRISELRPKDLERLAKYHKSRQRLIEMNNNNGKQNGE